MYVGHSLIRQRSQRHQQHLLDADQHEDISSVLPRDVTSDSAQPPHQPQPQPQPRSTSSSGAAQAADILALGRAALDVIGRALRSSPEVRANRVMARWPLDLEDLLLELEPMQNETPITELAARLGVSTAQLRSTALRLQRLALVKVSSAGVALTATGRQKLARLEMARAAVLRRIARGLETIQNDRSRMVIEALGVLIEQAERVVEEQLGQKPRIDRRPPPRTKSSISGVHPSPLLAHPSQPHAAHSQPAPRAASSPNPPTPASYVTTRIEPRGVSTPQGPAGGGSRTPPSGSA
jgi:hypothetical protein